MGRWRVGAVGGEDHGDFIVAGVDRLEEQAGTAAVDGEVSDLVDDGQRGAGVEADPLGQAVLAPRLVEGLDEFREGGAVDAPAGLDGGDAEGCREMALAPVPGGPSRWTTSVQSMKSSWLRARMRFLWRDSGEEKSKLSSIRRSFPRKVAFG